MAEIKAMKPSAWPPIKGEGVRVYGSKTVPLRAQARSAKDFDHGMG